MEPLLAALLPAAARTAESFGDAGAEGGLLPEEEALVARAVPRRRAEFATGRVCARRALAALGVPPGPVLAGPHREPLWPPGVVGSITHCDGYRAAAVARVADLASLGIDAEPNQPLPAGVLPAIARPEEIARLPSLAAMSPGTHWDRLLFSAKESVYKAWFPLARGWLGFQQAEITFAAAGREFWVSLLVDCPPDAAGLRGARGRFAVAGDLLVTALPVPPG